MKRTGTGSVPVIGLILTIAVYLILWASGAQAAGSMEGVKALIEEVQGILQTKSEKSQRLELIEKIEDHHLDFREMAKRSLQSTWAGLNRSQQDEFIEIFSKLMKAHIAKHLDTFAKTKVEYQGATTHSEASEVDILVVRPNDKIPVKFLLLHKPQGWMIYDMNIDGVSMADNFRTQFGTMIRMRSYGELVRTMKDRLMAEHASR
jgi:phospholipid transport system substrate-binding protein